MESITVAVVAGHVRILWGPFLFVGVHVDVHV